MLATTFVMRVVRNIDFVGGVNIAIKICHDTASISRYTIRYDISCHHYTVCYAFNNYGHHVHVLLFAIHTQQIIAYQVLHTNDTMLVCGSALLSYLA